MDLSQELGDGAVTALAQNDEGAPPAVAPVSVTIEREKAALGLPVSLWDKVKDKIGAAQTAIASPVQQFARNAATAAGASEKTASTVGAGFLPVVLVIVVIAGVVYYLRKHGRKVTA